jgi:N-acetylmuramoyl-L-alanine amidase
MAGFTPGVGIVSGIRASPNQGARRGEALIDMILLHYTGMPSAAEALALLCAGGTGIENRVSTHYFVYEDGRIIQCVPEARRAWHAGQSTWEGNTDVNSRSIGIEIANPGHDFGYPDFPEKQIGALIALCQDIVARHSIRPDRILAHSDVAPSRKRDPGEKFPWPRLFEHGIGLWVRPELPAGGLYLEDQGDGVMELQTALMAYGYGLKPTGHYDCGTRDVVMAFQRHFRPAQVDGRADRSTTETLKRLLIARNQARELRR